MRSISTDISKSLYDRIKLEKARLAKKEMKKIKSRRKRITLILASDNLAKRLR